jgi:radical SAM superfamily enzyme YgiQ (UPF0313 family)
MNHSKWYEKVFPALSGFGLWLRGGELNTVPAAGFERRSFRVLIARLSTWRDTADSFTHKLLFQIVAKIDGAYPDLAYLPPPKDVPLFDAHGVPWLIGATSKRDAREFSVLALSLSIVQEIVNVPVMLKKSGVPLSKKERLRDPACPLVILGGASALYTSALYGADPPVDGIFIGEDAPTIKRLFRICQEGFSRKTAKNAILARLRSVPGFFEPDGERSTSIFQAPRLPVEQLLESGPVLYAKECIGRAHLQISEGCSHWCGFCAESFSRKPYREFSLPVLCSAALRQKAATGAFDVEVYSFNFGMHGDFYRILRALSSLFPSLGLKSQRADSLAADPDMLTYLHAVNKTSITLGIEGISPRLRRYCSKGLDEADLIKCLRAVLASPVRELKIFVVATGLERPDDYEGFRELLAFIKETMHDAARAPRVIFSMTILVRFPWTPLEFEDAPGPSVCQSVLHSTGRLVRAAGFEFRSSSDSADFWVSQVLARAQDPRVGFALARAQEKTGFIYYRDIPGPFVTEFRKQLEQEGLRPDALCAGFPPKERASRPWNGLRTGVSADFLAKQWTAAQRYEETGRCGGPAVRRVPEAKPYTADNLRAALRAAKTQEIALVFRMRIGPALAGVPGAVRGTALARALMLTDKGLTEGYRGLRPSPVFNGTDSDWVFGDGCCVLVWSPDAATALRELVKDTAFIDKVNILLEGRATMAGLCGPDSAAVKTVTFQSPFRFDPSAYCRKKSLKLTLSKTEHGTVLYSLSKESLRKKIFSACSAQESPGGEWAVVVTPGPKFLPEEFARTAFMLPSENEWVRIGMTVEFEKDR